MQKDFYLLLDILFYFVLPILFWETSRDFLPDYLAMILSAMPGILYSFSRFLSTGSLNFTRTFLLVNILAELAVDLLSGSAIQLLWNTAFFSLGISLIYITSSFVNKPLFLYFSLDILVLQGSDRAITKRILFEKKPLRILKMVTFLNGLRELIYALILIKFISKYGVNVYSFSILLDQLFGFVMSGFSIVSFFLIHHYMNNVISVKKPSRRKTMRLTLRWFHFHFERSYFYIYKHH